MLDHYIESLPPVLPKAPKILILGSMPGVESLRRGEYYAFPRNFFWPIMYHLLEVRRDPWMDTYRERIDILLSHDIALWDVLYRCKREGSLDHTIRDTAYNPITDLLEQNPSIKALFCNGTTSFSHLRRMVKSDISSEAGGSLSWRGDVTVYKMPSTSPVPSRKYRNLQDRLKEWSRVTEYI